MAWDVFFQNPLPVTALAIEDCFNETSVDNRGFSLIHRFILYHEKTINLGSILQASTAAVNATDSKGQTALGWALFLGDAESAELLLAAGANQYCRALGNRWATPRGGSAQSFSFAQITAIYGESFCPWMEGSTNGMQ